MKKHFFITILFTVLIGMAGTSALAHDIEVPNADGVTIYYVWTNNNTELEVSFKGSYVSSYWGEYSGTVVIPPSVMYNGKSYNVTSIGVGAFYQCSSLNSVTIPNGVKSIGYEAFCGSSLTSVMIPSSVTSIDKYAFDDCSDLTLVISEINNPFAINENVFPKNNAATLIVPSGKKYVYQNTAGWSMLQNIVERNKRTIHVATAGTLHNLIPEDEKYLITDLTLTGELNGTDLGFLREMAGKVRVYINDVDNISERKGVESFLDSNPYPSDNTSGRLTVLDLSGVNIISGGDYLIIFLGTTNSNYNTIDCTVQSNEIPKFVFMGCKLLTSITIPKSVTSIGKRAFDGCTCLTSIISLNNTPPTLGSFVFGYNTNCIVWVPRGSANAYKEADGWKDFQNIRELSDDVNAQVVAEIDWTRESSYYHDMWYSDGCTVNVTSEGLVIESTPANGADYWDPQIPMIAHIPEITEGGHYQVKFTVNAPADGEIRLDFCSWDGSGATSAYVINVTAAESEYVVDFPDYPTECTDAMIFYQCGKMPGKHVIKKVQLVNVVNQKLIKGDANVDGVVNVADVVEVVNAVNGKPSNRFLLYNADQNGNGVDASDVKAIVDIIMQK